MNSRKKTNYEDQKPKESKFMKFMDILKIRFWSIAKFNLICLGIYTIFIVFYAFFISQIFFPIDVSDTSRDTRISASCWLYWFTGFPIH